MLTPILATLLCLFPGPTGQDEEPVRPPVRLIVLVSVDQMIPEQLERLEPWFTGGFRRFADGQVWRRAAHGHGGTATGPGHATLGTGRHPNAHGIVGNSWLPAGTSESVYCVQDDEVRLVTSDGVAGGAGGSPRNLLADGLADHLRRQQPGSRSVGISGKDRAAILSLGRSADAAVWWDRGGRGFVSSTFFGEALPDWVRDWNRTWADELGGYVWEDLLPEDIETAGTAADQRPGEVSAIGATFPHPAPALSEPPAPAELALFSRWVYGTPLVDRFVVELALRAVEGMDLGGDDQVDYLFVGLSACDTVGHSFGPYSREVTDLLLRADAELGRLFEDLDRRLGTDGWVAALSSDHGVLEFPEALQQRGFAARRVVTSHLADVERDLRQFLAESFGSDYLLYFDPTALMFDNGKIVADGIEPEEVHRLAVEIMLTNLDWLERGYTRSELEEALADQTKAAPLLTLMAHSFLAERSPDVVFVTDPWILLQGAGTTHGSPWAYDRRVPVAFIGPGSKPGDSFAPCWTVDVLPTLLFRAGIEVPEGLDGAVLD